MHESGEPQLRSKRPARARFPSWTAPEWLQGPCTRSPLRTRTLFRLGRHGRRTRGRADVRRVRDAARGRAESPHLDARLSRRLCRRPRAAEGAAGRVAALDDGRGPQAGTPRPRSQTRRRPPWFPGSLTPAGTAPATPSPSSESGGARPVPAGLSARPCPSHPPVRSTPRHGPACAADLPDVLPSVLPALRCRPPPAGRFRTGTGSAAAPCCFRADPPQRTAGETPPSPVLRFHPPRAAVRPPDACACGLSRDNSIKNWTE